MLSLICFLILLLRQHKTGEMVRTVILEMREFLLLSEIKGCELSVSSYFTNLAYHPEVLKIQLSP